MVAVDTLPFSLARAAKWYPDNEAFVQTFGGSERRFTYREVNERTNCFANGLLERGLNHGDVVALLTESSVETAIAHYGCTKVGIIPVGLRGRSTPKELARKIDRVEARAVVVHPSYVDKLDAVSEQLSTVETVIGLDHLGTVPSDSISYESLLSSSAPNDPNGSVAETDIAFLKFTSGTTGDPKAYPVRHKQAIRMATMGPGGQDDTERAMVGSSPGFMNWEAVTVTAVNNAATAVFFSGDVEQIPEAIEAERITQVGLSTTPWKLIYESGALGEHDISSIKSAQWASEPMSPTLYRTLRDTVTENFSAIYGMTELMRSAVVLHPHHIDEETIHSVGKPRPNVDVRTIEPGSGDPNAEVDEGDVGEIIITGPTVCQEVWDDPATTDELTRDGWVFTGDLGTIRDGFLYLRGRSDNMIISGGINIYPETVEKVLETHPDIEECAIIGVPHDKWGETVKAYVVASDDDLTANDLESWCKANDELANYQRPRRYDFVDDLPRTAQGKLDRNALRDTDQ